MQIDTGGNSGKILIVDDNLKNVELAVSLLQSENYEIAIANSGYDALEMLKEFVPDLILLDIMMPEMDGYEVCKIIKSQNQFKDIPILFLTAKTEPDDIIKGFKSGGVDYIKKPFNQDELIVRVSTHINLKHSLDIVIRQNEEKTALLSITAHDLKNLLQAIWGLLDILEIKIDRLEKEDILEIIYDIKNSTKTAIHITKDLLDLHKYEAGKFNLLLTTFSPFDILMSLIDQYQRISEEKQIKIIFKNSIEDILIYADKNKFERVLENLISNAVKFSPFNTKIIISLMQKQNSLVISFKDEGPGLSDNDKKQLFKKFAKLSPKPTGGETSSGLGLSIVKLLTESMHGSVYCISELGNGSEFFVEFPIAK
jgi:two-component system, sensor histidine kinase and response regulator